MSGAVGKGVLFDAQKKVLQDWDQLRQSWTDQNAQAFEQRYIAPIERHVHRATEAMDRLAEVADAARRACE